MIGQLAIECNAVIGDLEMENIKLKEELEEIKKGDSYWWRKWETAQHSNQGWMNRWRDAEDRAIKLESKLNKLHKETGQLQSLWRDHLDEGDPEDDNEWEAEARQVLWNTSDTEKQTEAEDYDSDVPF